VVCSQQLTGIGQPERSWDRLRHQPQRGKRAKQPSQGSCVGPNLLGELGPCPIRVSEQVSQPQLRRSVDSLRGHRTEDQLNQMTPRLQDSHGIRLTTVDGDLAAVHLE
jgi:hypothetical protein